MSRIAITLCLPDFTGASKMAKFYAEALIGAGHEVLVIHGPEPKVVDTSNTERTNFLVSLHEGGIQTVLLEELAFPLFPSVITKTAKIASEFGADCVIGVNARDRSVALKTANRLKLPGVLSLQNMHHFHGPMFVPRLKESYYRKAMQNHLTMGICSSTAVEDEMRERFSIPEERTCVVYNGVDVLNFPKATDEEIQQTRDAFQLQPDELMLVNIGRIDIQKGLEVLTSAFQQIIASGRKAKLIQVGDVLDGPNAAEMTNHFNSLKAFLKEHQLDDRFLFAGWRNDCPLLLRSADIYVHSAHWEGWPLSVVEAMGAELPVIMTDCSGRPAGFNDFEHGVIVPKNDPAALAGAVNKMIDLPAEERERIGQQGYQFALDNFEITRTGKKFVEIVEQMIEQNKKAHAPLTSS
ncbi:Spore coat protein SA [Polystyrenella longa]|uniref:Spore coat protein SA n=1 Tax=Polystyrenella longa TaxID=2528007 RepID=A0A518CQA7_9PLAN|nr:glycosyltransferase family 4 protein [Polystyrenella longa]QDU81412.1 Spore coat protein SA [Polystyrenella longa]